MKGIAGFLIVLTFLLSGCSTPESRIKEHPGLFGSLPADQQNAILEGKVTEGMDTNAVFLAIGKPDHVIRKVEAGKSTQSWIYTRHERYPAIGHPLHRPDRFYDPLFSGYDTLYEVPFLEVNFTQNKVMGWRRFFYPFEMAQGW